MFYEKRNICSVRTAVAVYGIHDLLIPYVCVSIRPFLLYSWYVCGVCMFGDVVFDYVMCV